MSYASVAIPRLAAQPVLPRPGLGCSIRLAREVGEIALQSLAVAMTLWLLVAAPGVLNEGAGTVAARSHVAHR